MGTIWTVFFGALAGTIIGTVIIIGAIAVWLYLTDPRRKRPPFTLGSIPESYLEEHIVKHFDTLFPGWRIFDDTPPDMANSDESRNPSGRQCHTKGGIIDLLCLDRQENLVVIELKKGRAPDRTVVQVERYINWIKENIAQPGQRVWGLIIAKSFGDRLFYALKCKRGIRIWTYDWQLKFNKRPRQK